MFKKRNDLEIVLILLKKEMPISAIAKELRLATINSYENTIHSRKTTSIIESKKRYIN